jgi:hypothetical protein
MKTIAVKAKEKAEKAFPMLRKEDAEKKAGQ